MSERPLSDIMKAGSGDARQLELGRLCGDELQQDGLRSARRSELVKMASVAQAEQGKAPGPNFERDGETIITKHAMGFDGLEHYRLNTGPTHEYGNLPQASATIRNIGWTLGNDCPYRCQHCYSMNARVKGKDMSIPMIDRIVDQLRVNGVETVNLGGNEPLFTNGPNPKNTLLPYIIKSLRDAGIVVGLTTSGITLLRLYRDHRDAFELLNDLDVSFDSPFEEEHNRNRGAKIFHHAIEALRICQKHNLPHTCIMCGMNWNFTIERIEALVLLAKQFDANVRINPVKPVTPQHMAFALPPKMYYDGFARFFDLCEPVELGEPPLAAVTSYPGARRCPCGRTSFRIHSITPDGRIHVSPCVYLHDYKSEVDLLEHDLADIIASPQFRVFRQRNRNPWHIEGCADCAFLDSCGGGCAGRSYLHRLHTTGVKTMRSRDPYCPKETRTATDAFRTIPALRTEQRLVHMDYLCTWIGKPL